ncbi:hypothetical protein ACSBR1_022504 [Camellia fascicularis]
MKDLTLKERECQFEIDIRRAQGLEVKRTLEDGNCLFCAVADQLYGDSDAYDLIELKTAPADFDFLQPIRPDTVSLTTLSFTGA